MTGRFPEAFVRLKGRNGATRELRALVDPATDYCVLPKPDAYRLGYPEAAHDDPISMPPNLITLVSSAGFSQGMLIKIEELSLGTLRVKDVDFLAFDLPQAVCYDSILGRTFFQASGTRLELDYSRLTMKLTKTESS
jgi:predicted aspartyl protease